MKWLFTLTLFLYANSGYCQDSVIIGNKGLNRIYEMDGPIHFSYQKSGKLLFVKEKGFFSNFHQSLIKGENDLFISIEGTGRVYQVTDKKNDSLFIKRLDSTVFFGYNNAAYSFINNDTIMSFGGFGYWRVNGQLRYYSFKNREWDIIALNEEIPVSKECVFYDNMLNQLYFLQMPYTDAAINKEYKQQFIYKLDLVSKRNLLLGELSPEVYSYFPFNLQYLSVQLSSLGGELIVLNGRNIHLFDFQNNKVYTLANKAIEKTIFASSTGVYIDLAFERNGKLFFSRSNDPYHQLDSIPISIKDFNIQDYPLYVPVNNYAYIYIGIGIVFISLFGFFIYRKRKKHNKPNSEEQEYALNDGKENEFKAHELELIEKIYQISLSGKSYSVDDVNQVLGLSKKSLEIQKKIRTETLNKINHRFKMKHETDEDLIERIRSDEDRRFYRYIIREENGKKALGL
jgi:LPXTG-motif cell wall-anchored protein